MADRLPGTGAANGRQRRGKQRRTTALSEGQGRWGTAPTLIFFAHGPYNPGVVKDAVVVLMLCALTGCGDPVEGAIPGGRTPGERLALRLAPYLPMLESMERVTVQQVRGDAQERPLTGPEPASTRTGSHRVVSSAALDSGQLTRLRDVLTAPATWRLEEPASPPPAVPFRVLVIQAGERMLKVALHHDAHLTAFSDGRVHHAVWLRLSDDGAASLEWIGEVPLVAR